MSIGNIATSAAFIEVMKKYARESTGNILELGSGFTTGVLAEVKGDSALISLEHSEEWYNDIIAKRPDLKEFVRLAPLSPYCGGMYMFYDVTQIPLAHGSVDLVICDGPPGRQRIPGLFHIYPFLADKYTILFDDFQREHYQNGVKIWQMHEKKSDLKYFCGGGDGDFGILNCTKSNL